MPRTLVSVADPVVMTQAPSGAAAEHIGEQQDCRRPLQFDASFSREQVLEGLLPVRGGMIGVHGLIAPEVVGKDGRAKAYVSLAGMPHALMRARWISFHRF